MGHDNRGALQAAENSMEEAASVRARLQSCRDRHKINVGFSPCGIRFFNFICDKEFRATQLFAFHCAIRTHHNHAQIIQEKN
jgi:hypothetical protein